MLGRCDLCGIKDVRFRVFIENREIHCCQQCKALGGDIIRYSYIEELDKETGNVVLKEVK